MYSIDVYEIFSQYLVYFLTDSHFTQILKMALLSILLNVETQYFSQLWNQSETIYSQGMIYLIYIRLKL